MSTPLSVKYWHLSFLSSSSIRHNATALIILNQPFSKPLLKQLWHACSWRACADGGANRLHDILPDDERREFLPNLIRGDLDSIRQDVMSYYLNEDVNVFPDPDQYSTDLQKCLQSLTEFELSQQQQYTVVLLGGLSGRLDQTVHTLSLLHKLRKTRERVFAITDENVGWVLDSGEHSIQVGLDRMGPTCGLLPVGIDETILSTRGLEWNLTDTPSSFEGLVSTSNRIVGSEVWISTTKPIWWSVVLKEL